MLFKQNFFVVVAIYAGDTVQTKQDFAIYIVDTIQTKQYFAIYKITRTVIPERFILTQNT